MRPKNNFVKLFSEQDKILYILDTIILILYRKLYINIVSIILLNIEAKQYNIKINLAISCNPNLSKHFFLLGVNKYLHPYVFDKDCL